MGILAHKHESFKVFEIFCKRVQNEKVICISSIKSNHGTKFENVEFRSFYENLGKKEKKKQCTYPWKSCNQMATK